MKRILDCGPADFERMDGGALLEAIRLSEGRTILCEVLWPAAPLVDGVTNAEVTVAFGADLVLLNMFEGEDLAAIKGALGRPVGVNVEPSESVAPHRRASAENLRRVAGADFVVVTANPDADVGFGEMLSAVELARQTVPGAPVFAGKMHGSGGRGMIGTGAMTRLAEASTRSSFLPPARFRVAGSRSLRSLRTPRTPRARWWSPRSGPRRRDPTRRPSGSWPSPASGWGRMFCTSGTRQSRGSPTR